MPVRSSARGFLERFGMDFGGLDYNFLLLFDRDATWDQRPPRPVSSGATVIGNSDWLASEIAAGSPAAGSPAAGSPPGSTCRSAPSTTTWPRIRQARCRQSYGAGRLAWRQGAAVSGAAGGPARAGREAHAVPATSREAAVDPGQNLRLPAVHKVGWRNLAGRSPQCRLAGGLSRRPRRSGRRRCWTRCRRSPRSRRCGQAH
jgi:hypothetical protein